MVILIQILMKIKPLQIVASEGLGKNERPLPVSGMNRTPTVYPQNTLTPDDLLPKK